MPKKTPKKRTTKKRFSWNFNMDEKKRHELIGALLIGISIFALLSLFGFDCGSIGEKCLKFHQHAFGAGAIVVPILLLVVGRCYLVDKISIKRPERIIGIILLYISSLALYHHFNTPLNEEILPESLPSGGGIVGGMLLMFLRGYLGEDGACIVLGCLIIISVIMIATFSLGKGLLKVEEQVENGAKATKEKVASTYTHLQERRQEAIRQRQFFDQEKADEQSAAPKEKSILDLSELEDIDWGFASKVPRIKSNKSPVLHNEQPEVIARTEQPKESDLNTEESPAEENTVSAEEVVSLEEDTSEGEDMVPIFAEDDAVEEDIADELPEEAPPAENPKAGEADNNDAVEPQSEDEQQSSYQLPPLSLLKQAGGAKPSQRSKEITRNAQILEETLADFNVGAKVTDVSCGPSVTRYELEPAPGVKVSRIVNLSDDLALKLATSGIRIEAPIPGKAAIGIEVPNKEFIGVPFREIAESQSFQSAVSKLTVGLGKDIGGQPVIADLGKMPHLLVAGATGSGKSVCINTLITSILFRARPDEVKFILIDPKMVEFAAYDGIGHLMAPVVTDAKKAAGALNWAVREMERRYAMFAAEGVRDMARYNEVSEYPPLPSIVIIIDELADLMMVAPVDVEDAICRLAQKARAAGIHLILATQRPSVNVITGTIKANIPSRISFAVASQVDSRTILDMGGAEKLLGKGDMLYYPVGTSKPRRVQGAFISDDEIAAVIQHIKEQDRVQKEEHVVFPDMAEKNTSSDRAQMEDELLEKAIFTVLETGQASASMLQRKFRIGYTRAGRLIDIMEDMKIVGPSAGSKAREILMTSQQVQNMYFNTEKDEGADT